MKVEIYGNPKAPLLINRIQVGDTFQLSNMEPPKDTYLMIVGSKDQGPKVLCLNDNTFYPISEFKSEPLELIKTKVILDNS